MNDHIVSTWLEWPRGDKGEPMTCKCGFEFSGPGEFRNCEAFVTSTGKGGYICPKCGKAYVDGVEVTPPQFDEAENPDPEKERRDE